MKRRCSSATVMAPRRIEMATSPPFALTLSTAYSQFLIEAALLSLMSGVAGVFVGVAASAAFSKVLGWPTIIPPGAVLLSLVFSATLGVFFGMYPARQAARLNPIEALRYE